MENRIKILEPIVVLLECDYGAKMRYDDYVYCGNGMLAYYNIDAIRYPNENNLYECFGKFPSEKPKYYIPRKYIDWSKKDRLTLIKGVSLDDFLIEKIIDDDTFETSPFNKEGYDWYEILKNNAKKYLEIYNKK